MILIIQHSTEGKTTETVKRSVVARKGEREETDE